MTYYYHALSQWLPDTLPYPYQKDHLNEVLEEKIEVNHPISVGGWRIYQLSYDERMGRWSELSVVELISDPWLPVVYVGIFLLLAGGIALLFEVKTKKQTSNS